MKTDRREFIEKLAHASALVGLGINTSCLKKSPTGYLLALGKNPEGGAFLEILDLKNFKSTLIPTEVPGHATVVDPKNPSRALIFSKFNAKALEIDLSKKTTTRPFVSEENNVFYGHGVFSKDGNYVYSVESSADHDKAMIVIRDGKTLKTQGRIPAFGRHPHDLHISNDGKTLIVANTDGELNFKKPNGEKFTDPPRYSEKGKVQASVNFIDIQTSTLKKSMPIDKKTNMSIGHLAVTSKDDLLLGLVMNRFYTTPDDRKSLPFAVGFLPKNDDISYVYSAKDDKNEKTLAKFKKGSFSVAVDEKKDLVCHTHIAEKGLTFFNYKTKKLIKHFELANNPFGCSVRLDGQGFLVTDSLGIIHAIDAKSWEMKQVSKLSGTYSGHSLVVDKLS